jgi:hypothetical protein
LGIVVRENQWACWKVRNSDKGRKEGPEPKAEPRRRRAAIVRRNPLRKAMARRTGFRSRVDRRMGIEREMA